MLSISDPISAAAVTYYVDYLTNKGEGTYFGQAAQALGVEGSVTPEDFEALLLGYAPDGTALVQNAGDNNRQAGWDFTLSAPKSVSVLWSQLEENERHIIEECNEVAVKETLAFIEERAGLTRRGKGGVIRERAALLFALFQDHASRDLDPQLHTHCVLLNLAVREDGTTGTIWSKSGFELKMEAGAIYRLWLGEELVRRLGLRIESDDIGFRLSDVPEELCEEFSKRRKEIEADLDRTGGNSAIDAKRAALATRNATKKVNIDLLFLDWQRVGTHFGFGPIEAKSILYRRTQEIAREESEQTASVRKSEQAPKREEKQEPTQKRIIKPDPIQPTLREEAEEAERKTYNWPGFGKKAGTAVAFFASQFLHIQEYKIYLNVRPSFEDGRYVPPKPLIKTKYFGVGPKPVNWGEVRFRPFVGRYGELRIQKKSVVPNSPLQGLQASAIRWHRYTTTERLNAKSDRKRARKLKRAELLEKKFAKEKRRQQKPAAPNKANEEQSKKRTHTEQSDPRSVEEARRILRAEAERVRYQEMEARRDAEERKRRAEEERRRQEQSRSR